MNTLSSRKQSIKDLADLAAEERSIWIKRNSSYYDDDRRYMQFVIPNGASVLELGCGNGQLLATLKPSFGVGIDFSERMIDVAKRAYPELTFLVGDVEDPQTYSQLDRTYDFVVLSDTIGSLDDCEKTFKLLHRICTPDTRIVIAYYSWLWEPLLKLAETVGRKMPQTEQNWLTPDDIVGLLNLADFDVVRKEWRQLLPKYLFGLGPIVNRYIGTLPVIRRACLRNYLIARPYREHSLPTISTTVIIPCRNEKGNVEAAVKRLPRFCNDLEMIYVEGHSKDGTLEEIHRVIEAYPEYDIKVVRQEGKGKCDAVRKGFLHARGDVLMILDADLTTPPEDMPKFYDALIYGKGEFINGSRLVYPLESQAMRYLNQLANRIFSLLFTWLLNQRFTDTLCGTKVLMKKHYQRIAENRVYFGEFDPFGDFDLIFGAIKQNLKIVEVPVRYTSRSYGETQISRFQHGWLLLKMVIFAYRRLKAF